ncbi:MAG: NAD-dependent epimerase/dehydratase family protein, partial [Acidobacteria bacterium]|nr:NAD-dependent epimerase/dehydratase family protein [Acidobacteriota bacterium]
MTARATRITVTGGSGFLGARLVSLLCERGHDDIFVPRRREYDLVRADAIRRLFDEHPADLVIHLAAV